MQEQPKKSNALKWILLILVIFLVVGIGGCAILTAGCFKAAEEVFEEEAPTKVGVEGKPEEVKEEAKELEEFKVGDVVKIGDRELTVNNIERNWVEKDKYAMSPESGKEFIIVSVEIANKGKSTVSFNPYDFKVEDSNGVRKNTAYVGTVSDELHSGELAPGGKVTGNMPFEVPKDDKGLKLIFQPSFWGKEVVVKL